MMKKTVIMILLFSLGLVGCQGAKSVPETPTNIPAGSQEESSVVSEGTAMEEESSHTVSSPTESSRTTEESAKKEESSHAASSGTQSKPKPDESKDSTHSVGRKQVEKEYQEYIAKERDGYELVLKPPKNPEKLTKKQIEQIFEVQLPDNYVVKEYKFEIDF